MKFSLLPLLAASAGLAIQQACAAPIRVVVVTSHQEVSAKPNIRLGHAIAAANNGNGPMGMTAPNTRRRPCMAKKMREKAVSLSNAFRKAFGLPLIEADAHVASNWSHKSDHFVPLPFIGTPANMNAASSDNLHIVPVDHHKNFHHGMHHRRPTFLRRVHHALKALGPWEGRAVAFVLGCGIGVLLRMMWVMTVITYRMIRGGNDESREYTLVCEHYAEEILVPPPQYTYEKMEGGEHAEGEEGKTVA